MTATNFRNCSTTRTAGSARLVTATSAALDFPMSLDALPDNASGLQAVIDGCNFVGGSTLQVSSFMQYQVSHLIV